MAAKKLAAERSRQQMLPYPNRLSEGLGPIHFAVDQNRVVILDRCMIRLRRAIRGLIDSVDGKNGETRIPQWLIPQPTERIGRHLP
jgi:hypothetical protein